MIIDMINENQGEIRLIRELQCHSLRTLIFYNLKNIRSFDGSVNATQLYRALNEYRTGFPNFHFF